MLFNSTQFWFFFLFVTTVYFLTPWRWRWVFLVAASYYFYMCWKPEYAILLLASTIVDYSVGRALESLRDQGWRKTVLCASILVNFGVLFAFKYADFFSRSVKDVFDHYSIFVNMPQLHWILPVGVSFYTFQSVSYTIDVYRGIIPAERHFGIYAAYVTFFPQLVAGPINRAPHLLPQFKEKKHFTLDNVRVGLRWALWGMFKKVCVADLLAPAVATVYGDPKKFGGPALIVGTFFFAVQIYCDFSGYSDIAIGVARILGYDLAVNFRQPYFSRSVGEFWQRWHISLSTWFRDYLYYPMGGNRVSKLRWCLNILVVFVVSGLWHGANWTFVIWGALHGIYLVGERLRSGRVRGSADAPAGFLRETVSVAWVFLLVMVGWVFFRAQSVGDAFYILGHSVQWRGFSPINFFYLGLPRFELSLACFMIVVLFFADWLLWYQPARALRWWERTWVRWGCYAGIFYSIICFGVFEKVQFIYFQF